MPDDDDGCRQSRAVVSAARATKPDDQVASRDARE
jgi:hypothetical protein